MAQNDIEIGDAIACVDQATGQAGVLHVETDRVWVEFVGFGNPPKINADAPIYLHTSKGWVVSLFRNVDFSPSIPFWRRGEVDTVYHQRIVSNLAISGVSAWTADSKAQSVSFRVGPNCDFLWPPDRAQEIADLPIDGSTPDRNVLRMEVGVGKLSLDLALEGDPLRNKWTPTQSWLSFHFDEGAEPDECINLVGYLVSLFSLLAWYDLRIEEMKVREVDAPPNSHSHRVLLSGTDKATKRRSLNPLAISADNEEDREYLRSVLRMWIDRRSAWNESTGLMLAAVRRFNNVSAERALDACRWFEVIERATPGDGNDKRPAAMDEVVDAAVAKARECNLEGYEGWIRERLSAVRGEPRRKRVDRLAEVINDWLGDDLFDETGIGMIMAAYAARHKTGHGTLGPLRGEDARRLWGDIVAMETFCLLRTVADLPFSGNGMTWLRMHPLIRAFRKLRGERNG